MTVPAGQVPRASSRCSECVKAEDSHLGVDSSRQIAHFARETPAPCLHPMRPLSSMSQQQ